MRALEELAFIHREDFSGMNELVAAFQLWDRIGIDPSVAVKAIRSNLPQVQTAGVDPGARWARPCCRKCERL